MFLPAKGFSVCARIETHVGGRTWSTRPAVMPLHCYNLCLQEGFDIININKWDWGMVL